MIRALGIALAVAALLLSIQTFRTERLKADIRQANAEISELRQARQAAIKDAQTQQEQCAARVAEARRSSQAINDLIEAPHETDANGCATGVIGADELRNALQPNRRSERVR